MTRRSVHRTQWASQFAVASELCKRGYEVAFTMGNHPSVDIMAFSPGGLQFGIDVKGLYRRNYWLVGEKTPKVGLFYVFAFVPDDAANRFFVLTQDEVNAEIAADTAAGHQRAETKGHVMRDFQTGIRFAVAEKYENAWPTLPS